MKKLMLAAAIVCAVASGNAANFSWGFSSNMDQGSATEWLDEGTAMVFLGTIGQKSNGDGTFSLDFSQATLLADPAGFTDAGNGDFTLGAVYPDASLATTANPKLVNDADYTLLLFEKDGITEADLADYEGTYALVEGKAKATQNIAGTDYFAMTTSDAVTQGMWKTAAAPEPTSGLLLLLGVAGLALRRRRA